MARKRTPEETLERKRKNVAYNKAWAARQSDAKRMHMSAKARAKRKGLEFSIEVEDIIVPEFCPVLGLKLERGKGTQHLRSPSLDRKDNSKGYTKDNIAVVSQKLNMIKGDLSLKEIEALYKYVFGL